MEVREAMARSNMRKIKKLEKRVESLETLAEIMENSRMFYGELAGVAEKYLKMYEAGGIKIDTSDKRNDFLDTSEKMHMMRVETLEKLRIAKAELCRACGGC